MSIIHSSKAINYVDTDLKTDISESDSISFNTVNLRNDKISLIYTS
jgi:hypothetical protein